MSQRRGAHSYLRIPLMLLAVGDLFLLGSQLRPWSAALLVPGNENPAFDLALILPAYAWIAWWITGNHRSRYNLALAEGTYLGPLSGLLLVAQIALQGQTGDGQLGVVSYGLWAGAGVLWAIAGGRGARAAKHGGMGLFAGMWSALTGCLMASTFSLARMVPAIANIGLGESLRQSDALGSSGPTTAQILLSMVPVEGVLLLGVMAGAVLGLVSGMLAAPKQD
jgi:hypothetical protein